ncbi:MAG: hypothetical protein ACKO04_14615, partial [Actinomycetes bacterium]
MADPTKAPKGLLISGIVAVVLGLGSCVGGGAVAAGPVTEFFDSLSNLEGLPYGDTFEFEGTGSTAAVVRSGDALCAARDASGQAVQLDAPGADLSGGSSEQDFVVDSTFETTQGARYLVVCEGTGTGQFAVIAFPSNLGTIATGVAFGVGGGLLVVIGGALLIASLIARSRWKKSQQPGVAVPPPGQYPSEPPQAPPPPPGVG